MERTVVNCTPHFRLFSDSCQTARERCLQEFWSCCCISGYSKLPMQRLPFSFPSDDRSLPAKVHFQQAAAESWKCCCYATHEMPEMQQTKMSFCCSYKNPPCYKNKEGEATPDTLNDQITQESLAFAVFVVANVKFKRLFAVLLCVQAMAVTQSDVRCIDDCHILTHSIFSHGNTPPFKQRSNTAEHFSDESVECLKKPEQPGILILTYGLVLSFCSDFFKESTCRIVAAIRRVLFYLSNSWKLLDQRFCGI